jgi:translation initiation factor 2 subunit 3
MKDSICKNASLIPVCAQLNYNIDAILQAICDLPIPKRKLNTPPLMVIIRSFDVNKPGSDI